jgi:hypothetical protein
MLDPRCKIGFVDQHRNELGILCQVWMQALDCNRSIEACNAFHAREVHGRHAAGCNLCKQREAVNAYGGSDPLHCSVVKSLAPSHPEQTPKRSPKQ